VETLTTEQVMELQRLLAKQGYDVGEIDGKVGSGTRAAVKLAQIKAGLPADSYPDLALLERLGGAVRAPANAGEKPDKPSNIITIIRPGKPNTSVAR
jgi:peptidoglycan hydrolase-like protein with peptidoglycan-binding domain